MPLPSNPVDRLTTKITKNLGRTGDSNVADLVLDWVNDTQKKIGNRNNFWFMHAVQTDTWNAGDLSKSVPSGYKGIDNVFYSVAGVLGWTEIDSMDLEDYRKRYDDTTTGSPEAYLIREAPTSDYILRPVPNKTYSVDFLFWKYLDDLVASGTTNLLLSNYSEILESGGTQRGFEFLQEWDDAKVWENRFEMFYRDLTAENAERELPDELVLKARPDVKGTTIGTFRGR